MRYLMLVVLMFSLWTSQACASLVYETGTITEVYGEVDTIKMNGRLFKVLPKAPVREQVTRGSHKVEVRGTRSLIRPGAQVSLHVAGHLVIDILVERRSH